MLHATLVRHGTVLGNENDTQSLPADLLESDDPFVFGLCRRDEASNLDVDVIAAFALFHHSFNDAYVPAGY